MDGLLGIGFVKAVFAIFKGKPNHAFIVVVVVTSIVLGFWIIFADNPDDRSYGVIAIIFVFLVTLGRVVQILAQGNLREIREDDDEPVEEETSVLQGSAPDVRD